MKKPWARISRFFLSWAFLFFWAHLSAFHYHWSPELVDAYRQIHLLELEHAEEILLNQKQKDPENLVITYLEDCIFFYKFYITEDQDGCEQIKQLKDSRLSLLEQGPENAPEYYQFQA